MEIPVLYEDSDLVVLDKPSGVIVNRAETVQTETAQDWWDARYRDPSFVPATEDEAYFLERSGLVHRLDRETSGVFIMAKTPTAFIELLRQFRDREIHKEYLAITHGIWKMKSGLITAQIGRMRHNRQMMGVREDGRESSTEYTVEAEYTRAEFPKELKVDTRGYTGFSLVRFIPKTGRTHQIRVHARHLSHPLVGDPVYAGRKRAREDRKWAKRVMLHAESISFTHPIQKTEMSIKSEGKELAAVLSYLH